MSAFADNEGVACTTGFYGVWPKKNYDETILAAILNGPLANAFVATREGKTNVTKEIVKQIPVPRFSQNDLRKLKNLVAKYSESIKPVFFKPTGNENSELILKQIDALVLDAYKLPPQLEHELLRFFDGYSGDRHTSHTFTDYLPAGAESFFSLSMRLSPRFYKASVGAMREYLGTS